MGNVTFRAINRFVHEPSILFDIEPGVELPDWGFDLDLPLDQLCVFARHFDTAAPITRMPLYGLAVLDLSDADRERLGEATPDFLMAYPLGVVGTDHVGYGSFDLWVLRHIPVAERLKMIMQTAKIIGPGKPRPMVVLRRLLVLPYKDPTIAFDALKQGEKGPDFICLRMDLDAAMLANRAQWPPMPAMQTPSILDCRLSPGSFSMSGALLIGEDGCETLLPRNLATQLVRFQQLVRTSDSIKATKVGRGFDAIFGSYPSLEGTVFLGHRIEFRTEWFPLGHSLGEIAYSLPLAPGEKIQIAVIDWSRQDEASRTEDTSLAEQLQHDTFRERSLAESVKMVVTESQEGSSFMAGAALSAGAGIPLGAVSLGVGAALGIGGASSSSSGVRTVAGNTAQNISDAFHQASSSLRELNSTVVVQSSQAESATAKTRVIVNHNHSHALTMVYYEVLRHYRLLTRPASIRPVLFVKQQTPAFNYDLIFRFRSEIEANLIDASLKDCLAVVSKRHCLEINLQRQKDKLAKQGDPLADTTLGQITVTYDTGAVPPAPLSNVVFWLIPAAGGTPIQCNLVDNSMTPTSFGVNYPHILQNMNFGGPARIESGSEFTYSLQPVGLVHWKHVAAIRIDQTIAPANREENPDLRPWDLSHVRVVTQSGANKWVMVDGAPPSTVPHNGSVQMPVNAFVPPVDDVDDLLTDDELCCLNRILSHVTGHRAYYWQAIWRAEKAADRAMRLQEWKIGDILVSDLVENKLLDVVGDCIVVPIAVGAEVPLSRQFDVDSISAANEPFADYIEQILTLPARGVFAEAKLGNCNASEVIDPTRFWDWQLSPIPDEAPQISPTSTNSRSQPPTGTTPTSFPASLVNIVNPSNLPDPSGFSTAGSVLSALGQFRDMSGIAQLGSYLQTLSNNATTLASQGLKNADTGSLMNLINGSNLSNDQKASLIKDLLTNKVADASPAAKKADAPAAAPANPNAPNNPAPNNPATNNPVPNNPAPPKNAPKPANPPVPVKPVALSEKTRKLTFAFAFDTNDVMTGRWHVSIRSGGDFREEQRLLNSITGEEAVDIGDRMDMYVNSDFGGADDVTIQISGTVVQDPETLGAGAFGYLVKEWTTERSFSGTLKRADFDDAATFRVVQPTAAVTYAVTTTAQNGHASSQATTAVADFSVGAEAVVAFQDGAIVANGQPNVRITAKGTLDTTIQSHTSTPVEGGVEDVANFAARRVNGEALTFTVVNPNVINV